MRLQGAWTQATLVFWSRLHIAESKYQKNGSNLLSTAMMPFLGTDTKVIDSLPVTLLFNPETFSPINHPAATILFRNSFTSSTFPSCPSLPWFTIIPIGFLARCYCPIFLTQSFPSSFNNPLGFLLYKFFTFPTHTPIQISKTPLLSCIPFEVFSFTQNI